MRLLVTGGSGFIGTNLMELFIPLGIPLVNVDWNPPLNKDQAPFWKEVDIMDADQLQKAFEEFRPTHVVHLAARTDTDEKVDVEAYRQNHEGTRILLEVVKKFASIERIIVTSTQFVCEAGYEPKHDQDTGRSRYTVKARDGRSRSPQCRPSLSMAIIRPTTIWGPYSLRYRDVMFKVMRKGLYFHPGRGKVVRSYGYVGNVAWQIQQMLVAPTDKIQSQVYYVGDRPIDLKIWVGAVSQELLGKPVRYIPTWLIKTIAIGGDVLKFVGIPFPITSGRFRSMTSDYITDMDKTMNAFGEAPYSMEQGVKRIVNWYDTVSHAIRTPERIDVRAK